MSSCKGCEAKSGIRKSRFVILVLHVNYLVQVSGHHGSIAVSYFETREHFTFQIDNYVTCKNNAKMLLVYS